MRHWKRLVKDAIPKPIKIKTRSYLRMHRRTIASMASGNSIAVKAGKNTSCIADKSLLFWIDYSASMSIDFNEFLKDIIKIFRQSDISGVKDFYIVLFNSDYFIYKIDFRNSRAYRFQEVENKEDILKKTFIPKVKKEIKPLSELFDKDKIYGGFISDNIFEIIEYLLKTEEFHQVLFTDRDLLFGENINFFKKNLLKMSKKKFTIIFDHISVAETFIKLNDWKYKYLSCINR